MVVIEGTTLYVKFPDLSLVNDHIESLVILFPLNPLTKFITSFVLSRLKSLVIIPLYLGSLLTALLKSCKNALSLSLSSILFLNL